MVKFDVINPRGAMHGYVARDVADENLENDFMGEFLDEPMQGNLNNVDVNLPEEAAGTHSG